MAQLGARVNGIHEVTGSTPVWSTILRQVYSQLATAAGQHDLLAKDAIALVTTGLFQGSVW